ncbi:hypothetical protein [Streptomyces sp. NPDC057966]|uniref:hypothetical protein n=1 Tax=Streptomyces sp. NPDC057966 TaxID=3346292 RepID=UPI0036ECAF7F
MITAKGYQEGLAALRAVRDEIKPLERQLAKVQAELGKLHATRDQKVQELGQFEKAKADRLATSAGLSVIDVVALAPSLGPQEPASAPAEPPVTVFPPPMIIQGRTRPHRGSRNLLVPRPPPRLRHSSPHRPTR